VGNASEVLSVMKKVRPTIIITMPLEIEEVVLLLSNRVY